MNRLIIIGNGFDLAYRLPTSYRDFIDDYWVNIKTNKYEDNFITFNYSKDFNNKSVKNSEDFKKLIFETDFLHDKVAFSEDGDILLRYKNNHQLQTLEPKILSFKNEFFKIINKKNSENWVDIENEYYHQLKKIIISENLDKEFWSKEQKNLVEKLNSEFDEVKNLLENYLNHKVEKNNFPPRIEVQEFINIFEDNYYYKDLSINKFYKEISNKDIAEFERRIPKTPITIENHFLNFNYTETIPISQQFLDYKSEKIIQIHGSLNDDKNPINFGFGDEMDEDYKIIENLYDNEYLKNFKSIKYLEYSTYKYLLNYIESEPFQVFIMGHSCGLSDRTLLNTIFEHENCRSIKIFYHKKEDESDNYTEITQNISRHFNDKKLMREKIVNKTLCEPLPQIQLPKKV